MDVHPTKNVSIGIDPYPYVEPDIFFLRFGSKWLGGFLLTCFPTFQDLSGGIFHHRWEQKVIFCFNLFSWLVVWNMNFILPFHIWDVILPIDELHHFSRWLLHHQPEDVKKYLQWIGPCDPNFLKKLGKRERNLDFSARHPFLFGSCYIQCNKPSNSY